MLEVPIRSDNHQIVDNRRCGDPNIVGANRPSRPAEYSEDARVFFGHFRRDWHDVGYLINERQHHKHAYYLITNSDVGGLSGEEIQMVANVARYHRRAIPQLKHEGFDALSPKYKRIVRILSALLRIADGLDRTHFSVVRTLDVRLGATITISLHVTGDAELETWAAAGRADLFERVFRRRIKFSVISQDDPT